MSVQTANLQSSRTTNRDLWSLGVLPILALGSVAGLLGVYWDIAWHIDKGRDSFFSPPHNFIYAFMVVVLTMSLYGLVRDKRETPFHLTIGHTRLHPGMLIVAVGAMLVLFFAPADDLWHRVFGPDATLWGPMHLVGLLGFTMATFGGLLSSWLERSLTSTINPDPKRQRLFTISTVFFAVILLGWMMLYLAEFEYGIQVFPMFWQPLLLAGLPTFALVLVAKLAPVPWAATLTTLGFSVFRLLLAGYLTFTARLDLAGESQPALPFLILVGVVVDVLVQRKAPLWLIGIVAALVSLGSNYVQHQLGWYSGSLLVGVPLGILLSVVLAYLASAVAGSLPQKKLETEHFSKPNLGTNS
jgi:hypothetical protein